MTVYQKKLSVLALFLMAANSVDADLVPKKLWEFDFKEKTGKDIAYIYNAKIGRGAALVEVVANTNNDKYKHYVYWINSDGESFEVYETIGQVFALKVLIISETKVLVANSSKKSLIRLRRHQKSLLINKFKFNGNLGNTDDDQFASGERWIVTSNGNIIECYDAENWVESEGGNSEPQIMFSKITPNEVTIEGETVKGGTIERSTDLKNWKKLVKVNKGGFELFVDPTEKNKEFFRVKSE